jgi:hypothetical protein
MAQPTFDNLYRFQKDDGSCQDFYTRKEAQALVPKADLKSDKPAYFPQRFVFPPSYSIQEIPLSEQSRQALASGATPNGQMQFAVIGTDGSEKLFDKLDEAQHYCSSMNFTSSVKTEFYGMSGKNITPIEYRLEARPGFVLAAPKPRVLAPHEIAQSYIDKYIAAVQEAQKDKTMAFRPVVPHLNAKPDTLPVQQFEEVAEGSLMDYAIPGYAVDLEGSVYAINSSDGLRFFTNQEDAIKEAKFPYISPTKVSKRDLLDALEREATATAALMPTLGRTEDERGAIQKLKPWRGQAYSNPKDLAQDFVDAYRGEDVEYGASICEVNGKYYAQEAQQGNKAFVQLESCRAGNYAGSVHTHPKTALGRQSLLDQNSAALRKGVSYMGSADGSLQEYRPPVEPWNGRKRIHDFEIVDGRLSPIFTPEYQKYLESSIGSSLIRKTDQGGLQ